MKVLRTVVVLGLCVLVGSAVAQEQKKQQGAAARVAPKLKKGDALGAFYVTKCAGAESDQVPVGENLCYRCKNGARPQVIVFTRSTDPIVIRLAKRLDAAVNQHEDQQLRAFISVLGESKEQAEAEAKKLAAQAGVEQIPFVVPNDVQQGPENYGLNPKAAITIVIGNENQVVATYAVANPADLKIARVNKLIEQTLSPQDATAAPAKKAKPQDS
ncbi:MAG: hypothetical protein KatS3mg111_2511 [Pirellulaceae bacterium]|nr:MAG: hypothetical protein KatS3mg111_2511 [Pirellulaceae bacterium]